MHSAAVLRGGALLMWGDNSHGQCGVAFGDSPADPNPSPDPSPSIALNAGANSNRNPNRTPPSTRRRSTSNC
jgi:hypothetical protein